MIWLILIGCGVLHGCWVGYQWGVEDTERRWADDAVARKADAERTTP